MTHEEVLRDAERVHSLGERAAGISLSSVVLRLAEALVNGAATDPPVATLEEGAEYAFTIRVRARVVESSNHGHGQCFHLELERRDYVEERLVAVDPDEILQARRI